MPNTAAITQETLKVIVFTLGDYYFALPINAILQVTETPSEMTQHFDGLGLVMLENKSIMLLNLHSQLAYQAQPLKQGEFLILTQTREGELCGLPVDALPNMMELATDLVQPLPKAYRQTNLYGLAPFVTFVQLEGKEEKEAIYLLDIEAAVNFLS